MSASGPTPAPVSEPLLGEGSPASRLAAGRARAGALALVIGFAVLSLRPAWADTRRSGAMFMSPATQALQRDDTQNPGMLWVAEGAARWREAAPGGSCADCHGEAATSMRGVATRYPAFDTASRRVLTLGQRIAACRRTQQRVPEPGPQDDAVQLALATFVAHQSRGLPIAPPPGEAMAAAQRLGERLWQQPLGQLALSCAQCHDQLAGARLGGSAIPQGHPTGYPLYRLEWQAVGSLQRRMRNCLVGVRAEPFAAEAPEWTALESYLMRRAAGMPLETPAVRP